MTILSLGALHTYVLSSIPEFPWCGCRGLQHQTRRTRRKYPFSSKNNITELMNAVWAVSQTTCSTPGCGTVFSVLCLGGLQVLCMLRPQVFVLSWVLYFQLDQIRMKYFQRFMFTRFPESLFSNPRYIPMDIYSTPSVFVPRTLYSQCHWPWIPDRLFQGSLFPESHHSRVRMFSQELYNPIILFPKVPGARIPKVMCFDGPMFPRYHEPWGKEGWRIQEHRTLSTRHPRTWDSGYIGSWALVTLWAQPWSLGHFLMFP